MTLQEYLIAWAVYLAAAVPFTWLSWRVLKKFLFRELAYLLQGLLIAIVYTPWYVLPGEGALAPAVIIFLMDTITIDITSGIRALIPVVMAMLLALLATIVLSVIHRVGRHKQQASRVGREAEE